jgi:protein TonB
MIAFLLALAAAPAPSPPASTPPRAMTAIEEYPADALREHAEGIVRVALDIDERGRATSCTILQSSGHASLDAATCRLLTVRARYAPATVNGQPVKDVLKTAINWRIPTGP